MTPSEAAATGPTLTLRVRNPTSAGGWDGSKAGIGTQSREFARNRGTGSQIIPDSLGHGAGAVKSRGNLRNKDLTAATRAL